MVGLGDWTIINRDLERYVLEFLFRLCGSEVHDLEETKLMELQAEAEK